MKFNKIVALAFAAVLGFGAQTANAQSLSPSTKWHWDKGTIVVETPARPAGQKNVLGLKLPKYKTVRIGLVGLGMRGPGAVDNFCVLPGVEIVALCDFVEARAVAQNEKLRKRGLPPAAIYSGENGYKELCARPDIDLVYIATDWAHHFPVAECALKHGKNVADEVPSAMNLEECWKLVDLSEKMQKNCMILENCCYDWFEMRTLNMAQHGVFGEILRAQGAYIHNLDDFWDYYWKNPDGSDPEQLGWRLKYNRENRGDVYATHGLGPVAQALDIHRGDRMERLVSLSSDQFGMSAYATAKYGAESTEAERSYALGDMNTTLIRTARGKSILIQHDITSPRPYNRLHTISGTKGFAQKYPIRSLAFDPDAHHRLSDEQLDQMLRRYEHPITREIGEKAREVGGHGGMDFIMDYRLVYCLRHGLPLDQDVYDAAEWSSLAELTEASVRNGSMPVAMPDFTRGAWRKVEGFSHAMAE